MVTSRGNCSAVIERAKSEVRLKLALTVILNLCFYIPYGLLQRHVFFEPTRVVPSFLERQLPFSDEAVWVYLSIFFLMPIGPLLMADRKQLLRYGLGMLFIEAVAYAVFAIWPTWCPRPSEVGTNAAYRVLVTFDAPLNAFPSLHAAFALFSALCAGRVLSELGCHYLWKAGIGVWTGLILLGTLLTKQHTVADITAGAVLGCAAYFLVFTRAISPLPTKTVSSYKTENKIRPSSPAL